MNKKSLLTIERIIICINELNILTKNKDAEYFYDSLLINVLIDLVNEIEFNINKINSNLKDKYNNINWNIIKNEKYFDEVFGESIKIAKVWDLSSVILKQELLNKLIMLLEKEIPDYYKKVCNKRR